MNVDRQLTDALLRLHGKVHEWLRRSSAEEEARWLQHEKELESEIACETDDIKRLEKESQLRTLRDLLENLDNRLTAEYANLIFAYGLARLGAQTDSLSLEANAGPLSKSDDTVHRLLFRAFTYRIKQARSGGSCRGPLPAELLSPLPSAGEQELDERVVRYKFDRLRGKLLMLEPAEEVNPFRTWMRLRDPVYQDIDSLYEIKDSSELERETREVLEKPQNPGDRLKVLQAVFELFPRLPASFARSVLETACGFLVALPPVPDLRKQERERKATYEAISKLHKKAHSKAQAAYDRKYRHLAEVRERVSVMDIAARRAADGSDGALLQAVIRSLLQIIDAQRGDDLFHVIPVLAGRCLQSLQRLRLRRDLEQLLHRVTELIQNQPSVVLRRGGPDDERIGALRLLLNVAAGWLFLGRPELAASLTEEARTWLLAPMPGRLPYNVMEVTCRYIANLALSPVESALKGLDELLTGMEPLCDSLTTKTHFSQLRLQIIDAAVRAVVHLAHPEDDVDDYLAVSLN